MSVLSRIRLTHEHKKYAFVLLFMIVGALVISYGFNHLQGQQSTQKRVTSNLQQIVALKETQKAACLQANILRANTNVNALSGYQAWISVSHLPGARPYVQGSLRSVLRQTWIPLTNCRIPPPRGIEGYPVPSAVKFSVRMPPQTALVVPPQGP